MAPPIRLGRDPAAAEDERKVRAAYEHVSRVMQAMLDELGRRRRFPVLG